MPCQARAPVRCCRGAILVSRPRASARWWRKATLRRGCPIESRRPLLRHGCSPHAAADAAACVRPAAASWGKPLPQLPRSAGVAAGAGAGPHGGQPANSHRQAHLATLSEDWPGALASPSRPVPASRWCGVQPGLTQTTGELLFDPWAGAQKKIAQTKTGWKANDAPVPRKTRGRSPVVPLVAWSTATLKHSSKAPMWMPLASPGGSQKPAAFTPTSTQAVTRPGRLSAASNLQNIPMPHAVQPAASRQGPSAPGGWQLISGRLLPDRAAHPSTHPLRARRCCWRPTPTRRRAMPSPPALLTRQTRYRQRSAPAWQKQSTLRDLRHGRPSARARNRLSQVQAKEFLSKYKERYPGFRFSGAARSGWALSPAAMWRQSWGVAAPSAFDPRWHSAAERQATRRDRAGGARPRGMEAPATAGGANAQPIQLNRPNHQAGDGEARSKGCAPQGLPPELFAAGATTKLGAGGGPDALDTILAYGETGDGDARSPPAFQLWLDNRWGANWMENK